MVKKYLSIFLFLTVGCIQSESLNNDMDSPVNDEFTIYNKVVGDLENNNSEGVGMFDVMVQPVQEQIRDQVLAKRTEQEILRAKLAYTRILEAEIVERLRALRKAEKQEEQEKQEERAL